jgi:hypothetical protein
MDFASASVSCKGQLMSLTQSQIDDACADLAAGADVPEVLAWIETPKRTYRAEFDVGNIVTHKDGSGRSCGVVTAIVVRPSGVSYFVAWDHSAVPPTGEHSGADLVSTRKL